MSPFIAKAFQRKRLAPTSLAYLKVIHTWGSLELQVMQVLHDVHIVDQFSAVHCELELEAMWRVVRACLARVAATDDVVEIEDGLNAVLAFVAGRTPSWTLSKSWSTSRGRTSYEDGWSRPRV